MILCFLRLDETLRALEILQHPWVFFSWIGKCFLILRVTHKIKGFIRIRLHAATHRCVWLRVAVCGCVQLRT